MPALTDGQIKNAIKRVAKSKKTETLIDGEGRGTGRLVLTLKPQCVTSERRGARPRSCLAARR